jgi:hypothetical protein
LLRRETGETRRGEGIEIHCGLANQVMADLANAIAVLAETFNRGLDFAQEPAQLKSVSGIPGACFKALSPVDKFRTKIRSGGSDDGAHCFPFRSVKQSSEADVITRRSHTRESLRQFAECTDILALKLLQIHPFSTVEPGGENRLLSAGL